jgi:hypothetical protein
MNRKQRYLLDGLRKEPKESFENFARHFRTFVENDIQAQMIGSGKPGGLFTADEVLRYFQLVTEDVPLEETEFSIEQVLHLIVTDLLEYLCLLVRVLNYGVTFRLARVPSRVAAVL